ncbi:hypothetical protein CBP31_05285 [Oceanisphaera profunda]|uniref:Copper-binding protein n=1 Tax=Oceanisphaera profunda TaxID=1416627 RepID=A0A1Y0D3K6_9GAMM|nr:hypothetical protein [Oceanisphaera profunda]ART82110.1 hypothetical protein CBP31_05285 [Oceanisphaera profunda]
MKNLKLGWSAGLLCAMLTAPAFAAQPMDGVNEGTEKPAVMAGMHMTTTATIEAIDLDNRVVTLRNEEGEVTQMAVGEEARNLDQVKVGDRVTATYNVGVALALSPADTANKLRERVETDTLSRAALGQKPGGTIRKTVEAEGVVQAMDATARTVTLQGAEHTIKLAVDESIDMSTIKVGDRVDAVYQESVAIKVTPAS